MGLYCRQYNCLILFFHCLPSAKLIFYSAKDGWCGPDTFWCSTMSHFAMHTLLCTQSHVWWGSPQCLSTPADTSWMGKWGSKEEKKGSRQYVYTACNKDPQINLLSFGTFFILVKSCEAHHCIHSPFQQAWQALQGRNFINYLCRWTPPKLLHPHDLYMTKPPFCVTSYYIYCDPLVPTSLQEIWCARRYIMTNCIDVFPLNLEFNKLCLVFSLHIG